MKIFTNYRRRTAEDKILYEIPDDTCHVEMQGYIKAKERIENMILAGQRLMEHRKDLYDFQEGEEVDLDFEDPTRTKGFDMADATAIIHYLNDVEQGLEENHTNTSVPEKEPPAGSPEASEAIPEPGPE